MSAIPDTYHQSELSLYAQYILLKCFLDVEGMDKILLDDDFIAVRASGNHEKNISRMLVKFLKSLGMDNLINLSNDKIKSNLRTQFMNLKEIHNKTDKKEWLYAHENINSLSKMLPLSTADLAIYKLAFHIHAEKHFYQLLDMLLPGRQMANKWFPIIANLLDLSYKEVRHSLSLRGKLFSLDILQRNFTSTGDLDDLLGWGNIIDMQFFCELPLDSKNLLNNCLAPCPKSTLNINNFSHVDTIRDLALNYLQKAMTQQQKGVNILLYGAPGTGKTEFAMLLGKLLNLSCHMVAYEDEDGDPLSGESRLYKFQAAQSVMAGSEALLIFDEIEDVFAGSMMNRSIGQSMKAWMNNILESNSVPTIWISNNVRCMDPAFIRRFDLVLEMTDLPVDKRESLIRDLTQGELDEVSVRHFARQDHLPPAVLQRGFRVAATLGGDLGETSLMLFNQTLQAQGHLTISKPAKMQYSPDFVTCAEDLRAICAGLQARKQGRLCLYGPPGTGKTAWAAWLAEQLDMPLLAINGSDLLDKYVGETEQKIARAFARASAEKRVLLFDEVDSFVFTRGSTEHSWERTCVNEMLTQIERFEGVLVVTTNMMDVIDPAALRRFDLKLRFNFLAIEPLTALARAQADAMGLSLSDAQLARLQRMGNLAPGDFAAMARRHLFAPFVDAEQWINALQDECRIKTSSSRSIGFLA